MVSLMWLCLDLQCSPSPVTGLVYGFLFYILKARMESRDWRQSRIKDWYICLGGSLSGRLGNDSRMSLSSCLQAQSWARSHGSQKRTDSEDVFAFPCSSYVVCLL